MFLPLGVPDLGVVGPGAGAGHGAGTGEGAPPDLGRPLGGGGRDAHVWRDPWRTIILDSAQGRRNPAVLLGVALALHDDIQPPHDRVESLLDGGALAPDDGLRNGDRRVLEVLGSQFHFLLHNLGDDLDNLVLQEDFESRDQVGHRGTVVLSDLELVASFVLRLASFSKEVALAMS